MSTIPFPMIDSNTSMNPILSFIGLAADAGGQQRQALGRSWFAPPFRACLDVSRLRI
jgi:hypothetical protein